MNNKWLASQDALFKSRDILCQVNLTFFFAKDPKVWLSTPFCDTAVIPVLKTHTFHFMLFQHVLGSPLNSSIPASMNGPAVSLQSPGKSPPVCRMGTPHAATESGAWRGVQISSYSQWLCGEPSLPPIQTFYLLKGTHCLSSSFSDSLLTCSI